jgi:2-iminobutanoate/2-iminopropanoate deaminase
MLPKMLPAMILIGMLTGQSEAAAPDRAYVVPDGYDPASSPPFSNGLGVGATFYVSGHLGIDPATGHPGADPELEARLVLDAVKGTLEKGGLHMDDLVSVTIYCTDIALYDKFNAVYRTYFQGHFPTRAFIGVNQLVRGAHFEVAGIAVKPTPPKSKPAAKKGS